MSRTGKILSFLGLASLAVSVASAQSLPSSVAACAAEKDSLNRLVCFDREVAKYSQPAAAVAPKPATPAAPPPPPPVAAVTPPPAAAPAHDNFGMNSEVARKRETPATKKETPTELHASVASMSHRRCPPGLRRRVAAMHTARQFCRNRCPKRHLRRLPFQHVPSTPSHANGWRPSGCSSNDN